MYKLQTYLKVRSFTTPTSFGTPVPSLGSSYTELKKLAKIIYYIYNISPYSALKFGSAGWIMYRKCSTHII
jgi:hypothetical protein